MLFKFVIVTILIIFFSFMINASIVFFPEEFSNTMNVIGGIISGRSSGNYSTTGSTGRYRTTTTTIQSGTENGDSIDSNEIGADATSITSTTTTTTTIPSKSIIIEALRENYLIIFLIVVFIGISVGLFIFLKNKKSGGI